jgi:hypothetical protein
MNKYQLLKGTDFKAISEKTKEHGRSYSPNYVRQCLRGYQERTKYNSIIFDLGDEIVKDRVKQLNLGS